jgi:hypothetical protein
MSPTTLPPWASHSCCERALRSGAPVPGSPVGGGCGCCCEPPQPARIRAIAQRIVCLCMGTSYHSLGREAPRRPASLTSHLFCGAELTGPGRLPAVHGLRVIGPMGAPISAAGFPRGPPARLARAGALRDRCSHRFQGLELRKLRGKAREQREQRDHREALAFSWVVEFVKWTMRALAVAIQKPMTIPLERGICKSLWGPSPRRAS